MSLPAAYLPEAEEASPPPSLGTKGNRPVLGIGSWKHCARSWTALETTLSYTAFSAATSAPRP